MQKNDIFKIALTNFKGIEFAEFNLQEQCTVFYGINGVGKTTILRALKEISETFLVKCILSDEDMPIFVNYGVNRTVVDIPLRIRNTHIFDKESAHFLKLLKVE